MNTIRRKGIPLRVGFETISSKQFAQITGLSTGTINKYIRNGIIKTAETLSYPTGRLRYRLWREDAYKMKEQLYGEGKYSVSGEPGNSNKGDGFLL
jgi:hypothetical protein